MSSRTVCGPERVADLGAVDGDLRDAGAGVLVPDVAVLADRRPRDGAAHAAGTSSRKSRARRAKASGASRCGVWPMPSRRSNRAPGMPAATSAARAPATVSSSPAMTSVGAVDLRQASVERRHRALAGGTKAGGEAVRVAREADRPLALHQRPAPGPRGSRTPGSAPRRTRSEAIPSRSIRSARASSAVRRSARAGVVGDPRRRALEHQPGDRRPGGRRPGGARSGPRASSPGRRRATRRSAARSPASASAVASTVMASGGAAGVAPWPGRSGAITRRRAANASRWSSHDAPEPVNPWRRSSGRPLPRSATCQSIPAARVPVTPEPPAPRAPAGPRPPRPGAAPRSVPGPCAAPGRARPGRPTELRISASRSSRRHEAVLAAQRRDRRPDVDPVRLAVQLLVVLGQAGSRDGHARLGLGQEREDPAAVVVDQHDRQVQAVEPRRDQRVEVVEVGDVADHERDRPARPPPRTPARSTRRRRCRWRRGSRGP